MRTSRKLKTQKRARRVTYVEWFESILATCGNDIKTNRKSDQTGEGVKVSSNWFQVFIFSFVTMVLY